MRHPDLYLPTFCARETPSTEIVLALDHLLSAWKQYWKIQDDANRPEKCKEVDPRHKITQVWYSFHPRNQSNACKTGSPISTLQLNLGFWVQNLMSWSLNGVNNSIFFPSRFVTPTSHTYLALIVPSNCRAKLTNVSQLTFGHSETWTRGLQTSTFDTNRLIKVRHSEIKRDIRVIKGVITPSNDPDQETI